MEEVYRNALRAMAEQAKAADMDVAIGWGVLLALLDENEQLRRQRDMLVSNCRSAIKIAAGSQRANERINQMAARLEYTVKRFEVIE